MVTNYYIHHHFDFLNYPYTLERSIGDGFTPDGFHWLLLKRENPDWKGEFNTRVTLLQGAMTFDRSNSRGNYRRSQRDCSCIDLYQTPCTLTLTLSSTTSPVRDKNFQHLSIMTKYTRYLDIASRCPSSPPNYLDIVYLRCTPRGDTSNRLRKALATTVYIYPVLS